jgi:hypothetical protein
MPLALHTLDKIGAVPIEHIEMSADTFGRERLVIECQLIDYAVECTIALDLVTNADIASVTEG